MIYDTLLYLTPASVTALQQRCIVPLFTLNERHYHVLQTLPQWPNCFSYGSRKLVLPVPMNCTILTQQPSHTRIGGIFSCRIV